MDKKILNTLNNGEHVVEIKECLLHDEYVYKVTVYTCVKKLFWKRFKNFTFPFYFASKEFAEEFLKYYDDFYLSTGCYWDGYDKWCYLLNATHGLGEGTYWMVDDYKYRRYAGEKHHLYKGGVWNGIVNIDARYYTFNSKNINYKDILNRESVLSSTNNTYIFKMIK